MSALVDTKSRPIELIEELRFTPAESGQSSNRVDREARVIRRVKVVGLRSGNPASFLGSGLGLGGNPQPYEYSLEALREAVPLYEGAPVNIDHVPYAIGADGVRRAANVKRKTAERFGRLAQVSVEPDGLYADLQYLAAHPLAPLILEAAERMPEALALSHHAVGIPVLRNGHAVVDKIVAVRSVDLIGERPGTTTSLFESLGAARPMDDSAISVLDPPEAGFLDPSMTTEDGQRDRPPLRAALLHVLGEETFDDPALAQKVAEIIRCYGVDAQEDLDESTLLRRQLAEFERRDAARALFESRNIRATEAMVRAVAGLKNDADRVALIESLGTASAAGGSYTGLFGRRPKSSPPAHSGYARREPGGKGLARAVRG